MDKNLHNIDQFFKDGIEGHTDPPDDLVWKNIDQQLDKEEVIVTKHRYQLIRRSLITVAALFLFFVFLLVFTYNNNPAEIKADTDSVNLQQEATPPASADTPQANTTPEKKETASGSQLGKESSKEEEQPVNETTVTQPDNKAAFETRKQVLTANENRKDNITGQTIKTEHVLTAEVKSKKKPGKEKMKENEIVSSGDKPLNKLNAHPVAGKFSTGKTSVPIEKGNPLANSNLVIEIQPTSPATFNNSLMQPIDADFFSGEEFLKKIRFRNTVAENSLSAMQKQGVIPVIKRPKEKAGLSVAAFYSPEAVTNHVSEGRREHREDDRDVIREGEKVKYSGSFGLQFNYQLKENWSLFSGITISKTVSTILPRNIYARPERGGGPQGGGDLKYKLNCTAGYAYVPAKSGSAPLFGDSIQALQSTNILAYVSIPVGVKYTFRKNKFGLNALGSINTNILTKSNVQATVTEQTGTKTQSTVPVEGLKPAYLSGMVGIGAEYFMNNRISLFATPASTFSFFSINKDTPAATKQSSFGMQAGIRFSL